MTDFGCAKKNRCKHYLNEKYCIEYTRTTLETIFKFRTYPSKSLRMTTEVTFCYVTNYLETLSEEYFAQYRSRNFKLKLLINMLNCILRSFVRLLFWTCKSIGLVNLLF